ncbi:hypothetical protein BDW71DRAFT_217490 [Aspergillus fruticulosus]
MRPPVGTIPAVSELCCAALNRSISNRVDFPGGTAYNESLRSYFGVNAQLSPRCVILPLSAEDVSVAVRTLTSQPEPCLFAIRSGGHTTSLGASSIEAGVTIDLSWMNTTTYDPSTETAFIQPGARWGSVYDILLQHNAMVPGGRTASVGVGGYLTGGGNSFHAARVGLACLSIKGYEIVLANGEIARADRHSNPNLFRALKGGSNNFGIVTMFDMETFSTENTIWGGSAIYDISMKDQYIAAGTGFTNSIPNDPYASWVGLFGYNSTVDQTAIFTSLAYTRPVQNWPEAFSEFYAIPNITHTLRPATVLDLAVENTFPYGYRNVLQTGTYLNRAEIIQKAVAILSDQVQRAKSRARGKDYGLLAIVQPWVPLFWEHSEARGGDVLGLERFEANMLNIAWDYSWDDSADDELLYELARSAREELDEYARSIGAYNEYIYLNYAGHSQDPLRGYGPENLEFLRRVSVEFDPDGVFQNLVPGGFKIDRA